MRIAFPLVTIGVMSACLAPPKVDLPICTAADVRREPARSCTATSTFDGYYAALGGKLADELRHRYPPGIALRVGFDAGGAIESICAGDVHAEAPASARNRLGRAFDALRGIEGAPSCLAGTSLDLELAVEQHIRPTRRTRIPSEPLASCSTLRRHLCTDMHDPVCAVYPDGGTRTYANACEACSDSFVTGYFAGSCQSR